MPAITLEQLQKRQETIEKLLADQNGQLEPGRRRTLVKKLKRAQRKHRRLTTRAERRAGKPRTEETPEA